MRQEREWLRRRVRELEGQVERAATIESQNARLQALLDLREGMPGQSVAARITGVDASGLFRTATLNKGERDGVQKGMAVVAPAGVVGKVVSTSPNAARVLLLEDPSSGVDALVQRSRARGIVEGSLSGGCQLKYVKHREDLRVGDLVATSGLDGIFPKGVRGRADRAPVARGGRPVPDRRDRARGGLQQAGGGDGGGGARERGAARTPSQAIPADDGRNGS